MLGLGQWANLCAPAPSSPIADLLTPAWPGLLQPSPTFSITLEEPQSQGTQCFVQSLPSLPPMPCPQKTVAHICYLPLLCHLEAYQDLQLGFCPLEVWG